MTELFEAILKASFQGSIVILAVVALRFLLKKAPKTVICLLWLLAGLRLVMLFEIQSPFSLQPQLDHTNLSIQAQQPVQTPDILVQNPVGQPLDTPAEPVQIPDLPENPKTDTLIYGEQNTAAKPIDYSRLAARIWLLGAAAMLAASAFSYFKLKRRVREAYLIENGCFECPGLDTAFVLGFFPPRIYLPMGLSEEEKKFIFDHENTHIARHDHWFKVLGFCILSIHWFNPLVWLGYSLLCRDMELACDEHVVKYMTLPQRKAYSAALLSCGGHTARIAACPVAFGESNPKKRILNVLNYKRPSFWILLLAVAAVIFVSVCLLTSPEEQVEEPEETMKWNLEMQVTDVTPSGLRAEFIQHGVINPRDGGELMFGSEYALEKWVDGSWEPVEMLPQEYDVAWTTEAYLIGQNSTAPFQVDWEWLYGQLPPGQYRIGKGVTLRYYLLGNTEHETFYGTFTIEESEPRESVWSADMTDEEYLTLCREAMVNFWSAPEQYIYIETPGDATAVVNTYYIAENGWMFTYRQPLQDYIPIRWLCYGEENFRFTGDYDDQNLLTAPYYWQKNRIPEEPPLLPDMSAEYWKEIELNFRKAEQENGVEIITLWVSGSGDVYTFHFLNKELLYYDCGRNRYHVCFPNDGTVAEYLDRMYAEASAEAGKKPGTPDAAFYEELFSREIYGANEGYWIYELFTTFYLNPEEFVRQLSGCDRAEKIIGCMSWNVPDYAPDRFQQVLDELQAANGVDQSIVEKLCQYPLVLGENLTADQCMEKCRNALEAYQAQESWVILVENSFSGDAVLTENNAQLWYIDGEDWARMSVISNSDFLQENWHLCKEGHCYHRDSVTVHNPGNGEGYCNGWQDCEDISGWSLPWPLEFDWEDQEIHFIESRIVQMNGEYNSEITFILGEEPDFNQSAPMESCFVTFWFSRSGGVWQIDVRNIQIDTSGVKIAVDSTISLYAASPEEAGQMIHQCHNEALLHAQGICDNPKCTDSTHDHSGVSCTDVNCTNATHHHSNHHSDDHHH